MSERTALEFMSRKDVMERLDCKVSFLKDLRADGLLNVYRVGGKVYYSIKELNDLIRDGREA